MCHLILICSLLMMSIFHKNICFPDMKYSWFLLIISHSVIARHVWILVQYHLLLLTMLPSLRNLNVMLGLVGRHGNTASPWSSLLISQNSGQVRRFSLSKSKVDTVVCQFLDYKVYSWCINIWCSFVDREIVIKRKKIMNPQSFLKFWQTGFYQDTTYCILKSIIYSLHLIKWLTYQCNEYITLLIY